RTAYHVFDVAWLDGRDVTRLTLTDRRALLDALPLGAPLVRVRELHDAEPWERARAEGWEGVIAKRRDSPYEHRRSKHWLKMKGEAVPDFVIGGFTARQGSGVGLGGWLWGFFNGTTSRSPARSARGSTRRCSRRSARASTRSRSRRRRSRGRRGCRACA